MLLTESPHLDHLRNDDHGVELLVVAEYEALHDELGAVHGVLHDDRNHIPRGKQGCAYVKKLYNDFHNIEI